LEEKLKYRNLKYIRSRLIRI